MWAHDPWSAQDMSTYHNLCSPDMCIAKILPYSNRLVIFLDGGHPHYLCLGIEVFANHQTLLFQDLGYCHEHFWWHHSSVKNAKSQQGQNFQPRSIMVGGGVPWWRRSYYANWFEAGHFVLWLAIVNMDLEEFWSCPLTGLIKAWFQFDWTEAGIVTAHILNSQTFFGRT